MADSPSESTTSRLKTVILRSRYRKAIVRIVIVYTILILALFLAVYGGLSLYRVAFPSSQVDLTLGLRGAEEGSNPTLQILGTAYLHGDKAKAGTVQLTVRRWWPGTTVTFLAEIASDGSFKIDDISTGTPFDASDRLRVVAQASVPEIEGENERIFTGDTTAYWNTSRAGSFLSTYVPPVLYAAAIGIPFLYLYLFTGIYTRHKHNGAIILSYVTAMIFLVVPLVAPFFVGAYPDLQERMSRTPVGILRVHEANSVVLDQWALFVGGVPRVVDASEGSGAVTDATSSANPSSASESFYRFDVSSGLVIPLYVMILATIGGAINMTRRIPEYQLKIDDKLQEEADLGGGWLREGVPMIAWISRKFLPTYLLPTDEAETQEARVEAAARQKRLKELRKLIRRDRGNLIKQHMFLCTAPFLAMVSYYLLFMVQPELITSIPIVVLLSFSAGLMSETVLTGIMSKADNIIKGLTSEEEAAPPP